MFCYLCVCVCVCMLLTSSRNKLVVVFIDQRLHVTVQRTDLFHHTALLIHQLC